MQHFSGLTEDVLHQKEGISHTKERLRFLRQGSDKGGKQKEYSGKQ